MREPVAAGSLYASDSQELRVEIDRAINTANTEFTGPKVLVVPSCGLSTAPKVAGAAMVMLETEREHVQRVVVVSDYVPGPGERTFSGVAVPNAIAFRTPLGDLLLDRDITEALQHHPTVVANDRPFRTDTAIEAHLPPLQRLLGTVRIVPILVGEASAAEVVDVLERVWGGRETLIIISSDFASGRDAGQVMKHGAQVREAFEKNDRSRVESSQASAMTSLSALMAIVARRSMGLLELASASIPDPSDTRGSVDVGSFAAWESTGVALDASDVSHLRNLATSVVTATVLGAQVSGSELSRVPPALTVRRASVVTLRREGQARGSAGTIEADRSLAGSVVRNANAACSDPRLPSIQATELDDLEIAIMIVSPIERIFPESWNDLHQMVEPNRHGVLAIRREGRGAQLPAMWSRYPTPDAYISALAQKAAFTGSDKVGSASWYRFETIHY